MPSSPRFSSRKIRILTIVRLLVEGTPKDEIVRRVTVSRNTVSASKAELCAPAFVNEKAAKTAIQTMKRRTWK